MRRYKGRGAFSSGIRGETYVLCETIRASLASVGLSVCLSVCLSVLVCLQSNIGANAAARGQRCDRTSGAGRYPT